MRAVVIVIDSFGIGYLPDAEKYGDTGANTALHICETMNGAKWPNLQKMGLGNASLLLGNELPGCKAVTEPTASYGVMMEKSPGKDTTTGHWEIAGLELTKPFTVFPPEYPSFPEKLVKDFVDKIGRAVLGNVAASGTAIIEELGEEHMKTGNPIIYTSGDSVFQIAAHEEIIPVEELYSMCRTARDLCDQYQVGRVIARPFVGRPGNFLRTKGRKDFSIAYDGVSIFDFLKEKGVNTVGVGKIGDIFVERNINDSYHDKGNPACMARTEELLRKKIKTKEFLFVNYVDTDMNYGHRRDVKGYHDAVQAVDEHLGRVQEIIEEDDLLIITADHGCDPTFRGTDHTREYVPLLSYQKGMSGNSLGIREQFSDISASVARFFHLSGFPKGESYI